MVMRSAKNGTSSMGVYGVYGDASCEERNNFATF